MPASVPTILSAAAVQQLFPLHHLGWKAFQDLCVCVAEECLRRPVQNFLPNNDAGRDGAFVGRWEGDDPASGESTIQCKFTSKQELNLTPSLLADELEKARNLAAKGLAADYVIMTNHPITGESELAIKAQFEAVGVGRCRIFGADWITRQIKTSPKLRMMVPRLYGLGDLHDLLDGRAYAQAQIILSAMGEDLQRLVVTSAHRQAVRAISEFSLVLLLGSPAAGKSTIGAGIAVGASDIWESQAIKATSPQDVQNHISPDGGQFFWIDDAWGNTQYQRGRSEAWNQVFPLMNAAMRKGSRFLITSRDYIWRAAKQDLKLSALPVLSKSQVVIDVHELTVSERAQILYNHIKLGDQPPSFKTKIKPFLPRLAESDHFLPETARRLGSQFFAGSLVPTEPTLEKFFVEPREFLKEIIAGLSLECKAAIAVLFLNGGVVRSPVSSDNILLGAEAFGVSAGGVKDSLEALNGSLLLLAQDEQGPIWTYKHPTVSDAFAGYVAETSELIELYLRGARPHSIIFEVVCGGIKIEGAPVVVPDTLHHLLATRLKDLETFFLRTFLSYRSNAAFSQLMLSLRPDIMNGLSSYGSPIKSDPDSRLLSKLHSQGVLPEENRLRFFECAKEALVEHADASVFEEYHLKGVLRDDELDELIALAEEKVLPFVSSYVDSWRSGWDNEYPPDDHFSDLESSVKALCRAVTARSSGDPQPVSDAPLEELRVAIRSAISSMEDEYRDVSSTAAPLGQSTPQTTGLTGLFRDVDD